MGAVMANFFLVNYFFNTKLESGAVNNQYLYK
jgi:hypothetical protein